MFAAMFGGYYAKLRNIWIAYGFDQGLGGLGQICMTGCRAFGSSYTPSYLLKKEIVSLTNNLISSSENFSSTLYPLRRLAQES